MSLRFRKSIKIIPGVRINISRSGLSTSIGAKGATVNLKPGRKARATVGIPGTGLSYTTTLSSESSAVAPTAQLPSSPRRTAGSRILQALGIGIATLGALTCFGSWVFGLGIFGAGAALYAAASKP